MKDTEKQKFENEWRDAFQDAEVTPSDTLWTNIELELEKAEGGKMRRRLLYYKLTAAASIAFALCIAGAGVYFYNEQKNMMSGALAIDASQLLNNKAEQFNQDTERGAVNTATPATKNKDGISTSQNNRTETNGATTIVPIEKHAGLSTELKSTAEQITVASVENSTMQKPTNTMRVAEKVAQQNTTVHAEGLVANATVRSAVVDTEKQVSPPNNNASVHAVAKYDRSSVTTHDRLPNAAVSNSDGIHDVNTIANNVHSANNTNGTQLATKTEVNDNSIKDGQSLAKNDGRVVSPHLAAIDKTNLSPLVKTEKVKLVLPEKEAVDPLALMMARLQERENELMREEDPHTKKKEKQVLHEKVWTSLGLAAGMFNTNNSVKSSSTGSSLAKTTAESQSKAPGNTYSLGLALGTKVSNRWVVQGGLTYLTQVSNYATISAIGSPDLQSFRVGTINDLNTSTSTSDNSLSAIGNSDNGTTKKKAVRIAQYNVNNQVQFVSVPLQAGYLAINRKISVLINAGVSTDLFIKNTMAPENDDVKKATQTIGGESDYQPVNFNGLLNTELSYKLGSHYRLALNPGIRYPFSSIYRSETGITATPLTMDIAMRFRYIFH